MTSRDRQHLTTLITDQTTAKGQRRAAKSVHRQRKVSDRNRRNQAATRLRAQSRTDTAAATAVPAAGERRQQALRAWYPFRVPAHRTSSARLGGAYPFLTGVAPGTAGVPIGIDAYSGTTASFDPWQAYTDGRLSNPNVLLAGVIGQGKSALAKSLAVRALPFGRTAYVPCDVKGEWVPVAHAVGGVVLRIGLGSTTRLNPLDPGPRPKGVPVGEWQHAVTARRRQLLAAVAETILDRGLLPAERTALDVALEHSSISTDEVCLPAIVDALADPQADLAAGEHSTVAELAMAGRDVHHGLRRLVRGDLGGLFDGPSTATLDSSAPMVVLDLSQLATAGMATDLVGLVMTCASAWLESAIADPLGGQRWVIYDEAWRLLHILPLVRRMQAQWKLSRAYGIANLMVIHRLSDLDAAGAGASQARAIADGLLTDCSTRIVYRQETDQLGRTAAALGLTNPERQLLPHLARGSGLWKIGRTSHVIHHRLDRCATHRDPDDEQLNVPCRPRMCERFAYDTDDAMTGTHHQRRTS
jgi:hypothetical protein